MTEVTSIDVACVGAGYFSQFHYDSWQRIPQVRIVGSCDLERARAEATGCPAFTNLQHMLTRTNPRILDVILPPAAQDEVVRMGVAAGVPTIICQKPFCTDLSSARDLTKHARDHGSRLIIHENFRFQPWYRVIKTALDDALIGTVQNATFRLRPGDGQGPDAYLDRQPYFQTMPRFLIRETAVHWIDTFRFLLGTPTAVYADLRRLNPVISGEDAGHIIFDFPGGPRAVFDGNRHLDHSTDNLRRTMGEALIEGTKGAIMLRGDGSVTVRRFGETGEQCLLPPDQSPNFGGDCVHALQSHVVSSVLNGDPPENEAHAYLDVLEIENAVYTSAREGRKITLSLS